MSDRAELLAWRPPPPGDPVPPFKSPVVLTLAPPVPLPDLGRPAREPHRHGLSLRPRRFAVAAGAPWPVLRPPRARPASALAR